MSCRASLTYSVLADDVGGVGFCRFLCFPGSKRVLCSVLQQPVDQSLQQRQLRAKMVLLTGWSGDGERNPAIFISCPQLTLMP